MGLVYFVVEEKKKRKWMKIFGGLRLERKGLLGNIIGDEEVVDWLGGVVN